MFKPFAPESMTGQVALITGAGGGIGRALARRLSGSGVRLVLADLREGPLRAMAEERRATEVLLWTGDLTREDAVRELFRATLGRFGRLDIALNAAGLLRATPLEEISKSEWDRVLDASAGSTFLVCRECCEPMRRQGYGRIVNFASMAGQVGGVLAGAHYSAAKAAVISITRSVAKHLAPHGVRCNAVAPGAVDTEMLHEFSPEQRERLRAGAPVGRLAAPEEIAELAVWLASPAADFVTGQTININGGVYLG